MATHEITFEGQEAETRSGPFSTRTDLLFEKLFSVRGETTTSLFVNVANLFNQRDLSQLSSLAFNGSDYTSMGLDRPRPDDKNYLKWGDDYQTIPVRRTAEAGGGRVQSLPFKGASWLWFASEQCRMEVVTGPPSPLSVFV